MLRLQARCVHVLEAHRTELVRDEFENPLPVGLSCVAAIAVPAAELLQFVVQVLHRSLSVSSASCPASSTLLVSIQSGECCCPSRVPVAHGNCEGHGRH